MTWAPPDLPTIGPAGDHSSGGSLGSWPPSLWLDSKPPPRRPRRGRSSTVALFMAVAVASGSAGAAVGLAAHALMSRLPVASSNVAAPPVAIAGSATAGTAGSELDAATIAARVDPEVVDVTSTLTGQHAIAAGTGMVITSSGEVLTNHHVIAGAGSIRVQIGGTGQMRVATVIGDDPIDDLALLQIAGVSNLRTVTLGASSRVAIGDPVVAIGNAFGAGGVPSATQGVVSGLHWTITATGSAGQAETLTGMIRIDAPIQPGDSGGPLLDASGRVIGMNTAAGTLNVNREPQSAVGFAIPIDIARAFAQHPGRVPPRGSA